jgi:retron-type reverse transcriptase
MEPLLHDASFGFRPNLDCHQALERVLEFHTAGDRVALDADLKGFFDNLPLAIIREAVAAQVADGNILNLIERFLRCGVMEDGVFKPTTMGSPPGGVISPLLANLVLHHLDWRLHQRGLRFVRYADDVVVLCQTRAQAQEALVLALTHRRPRAGARRATSAASRQLGYPSGESVSPAAELRPTATIPVLNGSCVGA